MLMPQEVGSGPRCHSGEPWCSEMGLRAKKERTLLEEWGITRTSQEAEEKGLQDGLSSKRVLEYPPTLRLGLLFLNGNGERNDQASQ